MNPFFIFTAEMPARKTTLTKWQQYTFFSSVLQKATEHLFSHPVSSLIILLLRFTNYFVSGLYLLNNEINLLNKNSTDFHHYYIIEIQRLAHEFATVIKEN